MKKGKKAKRAKKPARRTKRKPATKPKPKKKVKRVRKKKQARPKRLDLLSPNEMRVLRWVGQGYLTREIAEKMDVSPRTVETYRERAIRKLRIKNATYPKIAFKLAAGLM